MDYDSLLVQAGATHGRYWPDAYSFQEAMGIVPTGEWDEATVAALNVVLSSPSGSVDFYTSPIEEELKGAKGWVAIGAIALFIYMISRRRK